MYENHKNQRMELNKIKNIEKKTLNYMKAEHTKVRKCTHSQVT